MTQRPSAAPRAGAIAALLALGLAACGERIGDPQVEVAAELRALRTALQQAQTNAAPARPVATSESRAAADRAAIAAALQPLREALDGLVAEQRELQLRQLALLQELQRWSQLAAAGAAAAPRADVEGTESRLQKLEAAMQQQDARHREVEATLQRALDHTADRLGDFLQRLDAVRTGEAVPVPADARRGTANPNPAPAPAGGEPSGATPPKDAVEPSPDPGNARGTTGASAAPRGGRADLEIWWLALMGGGAVMALGFAWRVLRPRGPLAELQARPAAAPAQAANASTAAVPARAFAEPVGFDDGVQEIWAAAALLGEAVGRLKQEAQGSPDAPAAAADAPRDAAAAATAEADTDLDFDDVFVLDEEPLPDDVPAGASVAPEPPRPVAASPPEVACRLHPAAPAQALQDVLRVLGEDPRVLRRPQPTVALRGDRLDVTFAVLPSLLPGERAQIEQRLRDIVA